MVGEILAFHGRPEVFDGVEFRCIAGESFNAEPRSIRSEIFLNDFRAMRWKTVPEEENLSSTELPFQFFQEPDEISSFHTPGEYFEK